MQPPAQQPRLSRAPSRRVRISVAALLAALVALVATVLVMNRPATGDPGRLTETPIAVPDDLALPVLVNATTEWGLGELSIVPSADQMAGGVAVADLNGDGHDDLVIANGQVAFLLWNGAGYDEARFLPIDDAIGVTAADLDLDGASELLVATSGDADTIVWGFPARLNNAIPVMQALRSSGPSSGLLAGELTGDGRIDIVRLGRGRDGEPVPDILWTAEANRRYTASELPVPNRFSLAGELIDADNDGLLDIWITRDVGWARGGDSVLSRRGAVNGSWSDIADELGVALEVDGMGITIADLNGDSQIDAYVSDLGDNEQLLGSAEGFSPTFDTGAAHIRPIGATDDLVSSTWGSGALDVNLDGVVDLVLGSGGFPVGSVRNKIEGTDVVVAESPSVLLGVGDGTFAEAWPALGIDLDIVARGLAVADLDADGDDDIVIVDRRGPVYVLRNDTVGPTVTILPSPNCAGTAGLIVTIDDGPTSYQRLLAPHGYASSHGAAVIVGDPNGIVDVRLVGAGVMTESQVTAASAPRRRHVVSCQ